ncbi:hypothetical protein [Glaciibacter sp. 2TAF33]|uniref:hypothetical protein n=1 Tax=Glaciibacter sp. 2TAF33 TaxID=3233015 RepID=UPI003F8DCF9B
MNRIDIVYAGKPYSIGGRTLDDVQSEISAGVASGAPKWLKVNSGEGRAESAYLLLAEGVPVVLVDVEAEKGNVTELDATETIGLDVGSGL